MDRLFCYSSFVSYHLLLGFMLDFCPLFLFFHTYEYAGKNLPPEQPDLQDLATLISQEIDVQYIPFQ